MITSNLNGSYFGSVDHRPTGNLDVLDPILSMDRLGFTIVLLQIRSRGGIMPATPDITDANVARVAEAIAASHAPDIHHEGAFTQEAKTFLAALAAASTISSEPPAPVAPEDQIPVADQGATV